MYIYTGTTCTKCGQPHTIPRLWFAVIPPPVSCGCPTPQIITSTSTRTLTK